ncbi:MAG: hypothetical protein MJ233_05520 [Mycoplasmoidaceae bacterium]|nr:hypothetical protein [Mycoplasmoidaceae bacterium]
MTNYVSFNLELNEEKVIGKPTVSVKIISGGNLPATKLEGRLPDKIYHDTGFETNLIVHNEENEEGDPLY